MIKMVVIDVNGTLVSNRGILSVYDTRALVEARENKYIIVLATDRAFSSTKYICAKTQAHYGIFDNGSHIVDFTELQMTKDKPIEKSNFKKAVDFMGNMFKGKHTVLHNEEKNKENDTPQTNKNQQLIMDMSKIKTIRKDVMDYETVINLIQYAQEKGFHIHLKREFDELASSLEFSAAKYRDIDNRDAYSEELKSNITINDNLLNMISPNDEILRAVLVSNQHLADEVTYVRENLLDQTTGLTEYSKYIYLDGVDDKAYYMDCGVSGRSKVAAALSLANDLGISPDEIMALGNDAELLKFAGYSVRMSQAGKTAMAITDATTVRNNGFGAVREALSLNLVKRR